MAVRFFQDLRKNDWVLIAASFLLVVFGLAAIYSVALGQGQGEFLNFKKQLVWLVAGIIIMLILSFVDYHFWRRFGWIGYGAGLVLLALVLTPLGATIRGTRGWFRLGPLNFQPVELMKVFLVAVLADAYGRYGRAIHKFGHLFLLGLVVFLPLILVMGQPDFGSATVLFFTWLISFVLMTKNKWHIALILSTVVVLALGAWFFVFQDYQKERVATFLNPSLEPQGSGYNVRQSVIAVGAGQFFGRGLGFGSQSQLKFIPESQTDFIFAVIAEEFGFVGVAIIVGLFALIFYRLSKIALSAPDDFGMFLAIIAMILIFVHAFINMGMCVGLLPVTGISLPFISYGGSFLLATLSFVGVSLNVYRAGLTGRRR